MAQKDEGSKGNILYTFQITWETVEIKEKPRKVLKFLKPIKEKKIEIKSVSCKKYSHNLLTANNMYVPPLIHHLKVDSIAEDPFSDTSKIVKLETVAISSEENLKSLFEKLKSNGWEIFGNI